MHITMTALMNLTHHLDKHTLLHPRGGAVHSFIGEGSEVYNLIVGDKRSYVLDQDIPSQTRKVLPFGLVVNL